jgi:hypothetical protein
VTLGRLKGWRPDYTSALGYYDTVNLAKRIRATTNITAGLGDYVCPPSGVSVLYNNIPGTVPKRIEYQQGATPEARLVKACDKLQLMLKVAVYERWGTGALAEFWDNPDNFPDGGFPAVKELFEALRERRNAGARL